MRPVVFRASLLLAIVTLSVPSLAEASSRRRTRRGAGAPLSFGAVRSDEGVLQTIASTRAGGTALLPPGTFRSAIVIDRPMRIVGSPYGTTLDAAGLGLPAIEVLEGVTDVTIEGLRLSGAAGDGLAARGGNDRLVLERVSIVGCSGDGARVAASDAVAIDRCTFDGNGADGLDAAGRNLRASRLYFHGARGAGAVLRGEGAILSDSLFEGGAVGVVFAGKGASAIRNTFRGAALAARFDASADTCAFRRNDVRACQTAAATAAGSIYDVVADNRVVGSASDAVRLQGTWHTVQGNDLSSLGAAGVVADGDSFTIADNRIDRPAGSGVVLDGRGCMLDGNRVLAPAASGLDVVGDGNVVALNGCDGAGGDAILVAGAMNRVVGNTAQGAAGEGLRLAGDANTLQDNVLRQTGGNGIHVASGVGNRAEGNAVTGCGGAGFLDEGVGTTLVKNRID